MMKSKEPEQAEKGFTLVELAIVMIIIGLLITGILKGQEMIANAQVTSTVAQIKGLDAAVSTFRDMYNAMPGDMRNPQVRLPNCTQACAFAGGGNSKIDTVSLGAATPYNSENRAFFTHMAAADLITGVSSNPPAGISFGEDLPETEIGASGFIVGYTGSGSPPDLIGPAMRAGHYLGISPDGAAAMPTSQNQGALTSSQAARIDRKLDDGMPNAGSVRASGSTSACVTGTNSRGEYFEAQDTASCNLYIRIQG